MSPFLVASFAGPWTDDERIILDFEMNVKSMRANRFVHGDAGNLALMRGHLVYALESVDNGENLGRLWIDASKGFAIAPAKGLQAGVNVVRGSIMVAVRGGDALYSEGKAVASLHAVHGHAIRALPTGGLLKWPYGSRSASSATSMPTLRALDLNGDPFFYFRAFTIFLPLHHALFRPAQ